MENNQTNVESSRPYRSGIIQGKLRPGHGQPKPDGVLLVLHIPQDVHHGVLGQCAEEEAHSLIGQLGNVVLVRLEVLQLSLVSLGTLHVLHRSLVHQALPAGLLELDTGFGRIRDRQTDRQTDRQIDVARQIFGRLKFVH